MITEREYELLSELGIRGSMQSLKRSIREWELTDMQAYVTAFAFIRKKCIISFDTGMGKTLIGAALMNIETSGGKWLFVSKNNNLSQNVAKLRRLLFNKKVVSTTCKDDDLKLFLLNSGHADVYVITFEALTSFALTHFLFENRKSFAGIIVDESHNIGNMGSQRSEMIKHMLRNCFEYQYFLTATPLTIDPIQILNQLNILDQELIPDPEELAMHFTTYKTGTITGYHHLDKLADYIGERYVNITRESQGMRGDYKPQLIIAKHDEDLQKLQNPFSIKEIKSNPKCMSVIALKTVVKKNLEKGKKGLIYANLEIYKSMLVDELSKICRVTRLDGTVSNSDKDIVVKDFNDGEYDVLVSNLTEGRDMNCDYIIFYEMTSLFKQFIGRGERGLEGRNLEIYFILLDKSYEIKFFYAHIYKTSILLDKLCGKDTAEIKAIENQLAEYLDLEDLMDLEELKSINKNAVW